MTKTFYHYTTDQGPCKYVSTEDSPNDRPHTLEYNLKDMIYYGHTNIKLIKIEVKEETEC